MNILNDIYKKRLEENESHIKFWDAYLCSLNSLNFSLYSDNLRVPILTPLGSRILFRGNIKHTNEVTVALGADYFVKCSLKQAEVLRQHRINGAKSKLNTFYKEKEFLENQLLGRENMYQNHENNIIEHTTEEEDKAWREKHKEKLRKYHQNKNKQDTSRNKNEDEELWRRLDELELQEELENELVNEVENDKGTIVFEDKNSCTFNIKEEEFSCTTIDSPQLKEPENVASIIHNIPNNTSKLNLLEQVIEKQKMLEARILELSNKERPSTKTESEILEKIEKIEQIEELEDEVNRLDKILNEDEDFSSSSSLESETQTKNKQTVSFADDDDESATLEITFTHSKIEPCNEPYDINKGITKPSDIYEAYKHLFSNDGTKSILKKSKYPIDDDDDDDNIKIKNIKKENMSICEEIPDLQVNKTIILKDVVENKTIVEENNTMVEEKRPSIFKQRRSKKT